MPRRKAVVAFRSRSAVRLKSLSWGVGMTL